MWAGQLFSSKLEAEIGRYHMLVRREGARCQRMKFPPGKLSVHPGRVGQGDLSAEALGTNASLQGCGNLAGRKHCDLQSKCNDVSNQVRGLVVWTYHFIKFVLKEKV